MSAWDAELFDDFFDPEGEWRMGRAVRWERARICSCQNALSGVAQPNHNFCWGTGRCWSDPIKLTIGVSGYDQRRDWRAFGDVPTGSMVLTIPVNCAAEGGERVRSKMYDEIGDLDRVTLLDDQERREFLLVKGQDDGVQHTIRSILGCRTSSKEDDLTWVEGTNFVIDNHRVRWLKGPLDGQTYILDAMISPTFYVYNARPMLRNHGGVELPKRMVMVPAELHDRNRRIGLGNGT